MIRHLTALVTLTVAAPMLQTTRPGATPGQDSIFVAVVDNKARPVAGLTAADFGVSIDDKLQEVVSVTPATTPPAIVIITDRLGLEVAYSPFDVQRTLTDFVKGIRTPLPDTRFALTTFDGPVVRLTTFSSPPADFNRAIGRLSTMATDAALLDALTDACQSLRTADTTRKVIFAVYAGYRPDMSVARPELVGEQLQLCGASVWAIEVRTTGENSFGNTNREVVIDRGTALSGGMRDIVASAAGLDTVAKNMAALIASQYLVTYAPGATRTTSVRKVGVKRTGVRVLAPAWIAR